MSAFAGFVALAQEPVGSYGVDAIDPKGDPSVDLELLRVKQFDFEKNTTPEEVATVLPGFTPHPRTVIPHNLGYSFDMPIYEARDSGVGGGEAPVGFQDLMVSAGFESNLSGAAGSDLILTPLTGPTPSLTIYRWERVLHDATPKWTLWRGRGCRTQSVEIGGPINGVANISGSGGSGNFPRDVDETAKPYGRTLSLAFFDLATKNLLLDQFGDAVAWTGNWEHAYYTPLVTTFAQIKLAAAAAAVQDWTITIENQIDEAPLLVGGVLMWEQRITGRTISFSATLKDRTAMLALVEAVRASLTGTPGDELVTLEVVMTDGKGSGGTTYTIESTLEYEDLQDGESNGGKNWAINGRATSDWSTSFAGDDELTITISETA